MIYKYIAAYLIIMNLIAFIAMGWDKRRAAAHGRRTPEKTLFTYALLGGSLGTIFGMYAFRHKTRHRKFTVGLPLILFAQLAIVAALVILL